MTIYALGKVEPRIEKGAYVADSLHAGNRSNVQDGALLHADPGFPLKVDEDVSVCRKVPGRTQAGRVSPQASPRRSHLRQMEKI